MGMSDEEKRLLEQKLIESALVWLPGEPDAIKKLEEVAEVYESELAEAVSKVVSKMKINATEVLASAVGYTQAGLVAFMFPVVTYSDGDHPWFLEIWFDESYNLAPRKFNLIELFERQVEDSDVTPDALKAFDLMMEKLKEVRDKLAAKV